MAIREAAAHLRKHHGLSVHAAAAVIAGKSRVVLDETTREHLDWVKLWSGGKMVSARMIELIITV